MKVVYSRRAAKDLEAILAFIATQSEPGRRRVDRRIKEVLERLAQQPRMGGSTGYRTSRRVIVTPFPYVIYYSLKRDDVILILSIRHSARPPSKRL